MFASAWPVVLVACGAGHLRQARDGTALGRLRKVRAGVGAQADDLPDALARSPNLQSLYGSPTFAVHSNLRRYSGWYNGNPSTLFPSSQTAIASEVVALAGGPEALICL